MAGAGPPGNEDERSRTGRGGWQNWGQGSLRRGSRVSVIDAIIPTAVIASARREVQLATEFLVEHKATKLGVSRS